MRTQTKTAGLEATGSVRDACSTAFAALASDLGDVQRGVNTLLWQTSELAALLDDGKEATDLTESARVAAGTLIELLGSEAPTNQGTIAVEARTALGAIKRETRALGAVASLTGITARSMNAPGLDDYIRSLRGFVASLAGDATALDEGVCAVARSRAQARDAAEAALAALAMALTALGDAKATSDAAALEETSLRARLGSEARSAADVARRETKALIAGVQFADEFAQRIARVEAMLGDDGPGSGRLAAAQIHALADDGDSVCDTAGVALDRLETVGAGLRAAFGDSHGDGPIAAAVRARRNALEAARSRETEMTAALDQVAGAADAIRDSITAAETRFAGLGSSADAIKVAAINATLFTARSGSARAALGVLAEAVRDSAEVAERQSDICRRAIARLSEGFDTARVDATATAATEFRSAMTTCATALDEADGALGRLSTMREKAGQAASSLLDAVQRCRASVDSVHSTQQDLRNLALSARPDDTVDAAYLQRFEPQYTMERERAVHRAVTGSPDPEPDQTPQGGATLDSIFF